MKKDLASDLSLDQGVNPGDREVAGAAGIDFQVKSRSEKSPGAVETELVGGACLVPGSNRVTS